MDKQLEEQKAKDRVMKAKVSLQFKCPFYAVPVMHARLMPSWDIPTACVNKYGEISYNPAWINEMEEDEVPGLLCHEILHVMLLHLAQIKKVSPRVWKVQGIAQDIKINYLILIGTVFNLPKNGYIPDKTKHTCLIPCIDYTVRDIDKKSVEDIINEIMPHFPKGFGQGGSSMIGEIGDSGRGGEEGDMTTDIHDGTSKAIAGAGSGDEARDNSKLAQEAKELSDRWKQITINALTLAKQQGNVPKGMEHLVEDLLEPKIDWREKLQRFLADKIPFDYTWSVRSKGSRALGIYLPSMRGEQLDVIVHMDSSGSVIAAAGEFLGEIKGILGCFENVHMTLLVVDSKLHDVFDLNSTDVDDIMDKVEKIKGGGGTSHAPVYAWVEENAPDAKVLISLTDGYSDWETYGPKFDIPLLTALGGGCYKTPNEFDKFSEVVIIDPN